MAQIRPRSALIVVDVQNDFCPGGALGVPEGDQIVPVVNQYIDEFQRENVPIYASRDWHPARTKHFAEFGGQWPPHCLQGTPGAEFHPELRLSPSTVVVSKGIDPEKDSYSIFDAFEPDGTPMADALRRRGVEHLYLGGLATDYCVKWSGSEGRKLGFEVTVLLDASRGVNLKPHDSEEALEELVREGCSVTTLSRLPGLRLP